jgi:endogenous inhibitor of DNA gyrase (YacG/DUF329 family)
MRCPSCDTPMKTMHTITTDGRGRVVREKCPKCGKELDVGYW